jgi:hypothetical protein
MRPASSTTIPKTDPNMVTRSRDPQTSHDAGAEQTPFKTTPLMDDILSLFRVRGEMTLEELVLAYQEYQRAFPDVVGLNTEQSIRSRASELRVAGLLKDTGETKLNTRNRRAMLLALVP